MALLRLLTEDLLIQLDVTQQGLEITQTNTEEVRLQIIIQIPIVQKEEAQVDLRLLEPLVVEVHQVEARHQHQEKEVTKKIPQA
jgi:hypothetical protein